MFTSILPSLCQGTGVRSKDAVSFFLFLLHCYIENNLFGTIQEICLSTKDSKDVLITEIDDDNEEMPVMQDSKFPVIPVIIVSSSCSWKSLQ